MAVGWFGFAGFGMSVAGYGCGVGWVWRGMAGGWYGFGLVWLGWVWLWLGMAWVWLVSALLGTGFARCLVACARLRVCVTLACSGSSTYASVSLCVSVVFLLVLFSYKSARV